MAKEDPITEELIVSLADCMAAAAATFNAHGYDQFIQAREHFKRTVHALCLAQIVISYSSEEGRVTRRVADRRVE